MPHHSLTRAESGFLAALGLATRPAPDEQGGRQFDHRGLTGDQKLQNKPTNSAPIPQKFSTEPTVQENPSSRLHSKPARRVGGEASPIALGSCRPPSQPRSEPRPLRMQSRPASYILSLI